MEPVSLARGVPGPELLPVAEIAECAQAVLAREPATVLSYGPPSGYAPLREWIADRHGVHPDRVLVTNGSLQGLIFVATHLLANRPGRVVVEGPTYDRPLKILPQLGAELVTVPLDSGGLDLDSLDAELATGRAAFVYTIPTFQNPSGVTLSRERRERLAAIAREGRTIVFEDDPYAHVRLEGEPLPSVFELAEGTGVVYASSFSKTLAPGLRTGYVVSPAELVAPVTTIAASTYVSPVLLTEAIVKEIVDRGLLAPALERICSLLRPRRDAMLAALERHLPEGSRWSRPAGGYFVWVDLPEAVAARALLEDAEAEGVTFVAGADFFAGRGGEHSLRLAYSAATPAEIERAIELLGALVGSLVRGRRRRPVAV